LAGYTTPHGFEGKKRGTRGVPPRKNQQITVVLDSARLPGVEILLVQNSGGKKKKKRRVNQNSTTSLLRSAETKQNSARTGGTWTNLAAGGADRARDGPTEFFSSTNGSPCSRRLTTGFAEKKASWGGVENGGGSRLSEIPPPLHSRESLENFRGRESFEERESVCLWAGLGDLLGARL
jgi:hypothetical protein